MRNNTKLAIGTPCVIAAAILACTCCEVAGLIGEGFISIPGNPLAGLLYFASLVWSLLFTVRTIKQLKLRRTEQLFWVGIAAMPLLLLMMTVMTISQE